MKRLFIYSILIWHAVLLLSSCSDTQGDIQKVGMLTDGEVDNHAWEQKGYEGLEAISEKHDVDVFLKENIHTEQEVDRAVDELARKGVNLIFGHSSLYGRYFDSLANVYPNVHFVYFNGTYVGDTLTSVNLKTHAMAFFAGMVAGKMTENGEVGIIAAFEWQSEIEGFFEGAKYQNPGVDVHINFVKNWDDTKTALDIYNNRLEEGVDVFYPVGDPFSSEVIENAREDNVYAIGYMDEQSDIAPDTVLTSTIQEVDEVYEVIAKSFNEGELAGGALDFDFQQDAISLGTYNEAIPDDFQQELDEAVQTYIDSGLLPYERD